jgi:hypothetical protein
MTEAQEVGTGIERADRLSWIGLRGHRRIDRLPLPLEPGRFPSG